MNKSPVTIRPICFEIYNLIIVVAAICERYLCIYDE